MRTAAAAAVFACAMWSGVRPLTSFCTCLQMSGDAFCILDAIFHPQNQTYYVMDMMCWKVRSFLADLLQTPAPWLQWFKVGQHQTSADCRLCLQGYALYDCNAEFRLFWVASKLAETDAAQAGSNHNRYSIVALPAYHATPGALPCERATSRGYIWMQYSSNPSPCRLQPCGLKTFDGHSAAAFFR